jgi:ABC-2 type transport system ATP-binding protein
LGRSSHLDQERTQERVAIRTIGLCKTFGDQVAVHNLTLEVPQGIIFGLIGPSGCGKTTTVRLLTGVYKPTSGTAVVLGESPAEFRRQTRRKIGYMLQQSVLYPDLSARENLRFTHSVYGLSPFQPDDLDRALDFVELTQHQNKRVSQLSGGMQRRLSLASTLLHDPELLFLDEPTGGIDPVLRRKFWDRFDALKGQGRTLFVTTQYVNEAAHCDRIALLQAGHLLALDTPEGLRRRAFGGDVVDLVTDRRVAHDLLQKVQRVGKARQVERSGEMGLRITVDQASTAIPAILQYLQQQEIVTQSIKEYLAPFDDVFVRLIAQRKETERG